MYMIIYICKISYVLMLTAVFCWFL